MSWLILLVAGFMEATWAVALSKSQGMRKILPTAIFIIATVLSLTGLAIAMREIQTGTAYAVWTGIGATVTAVWSILSGEEKGSLQKYALLVCLILCIIGLNMASS